MAVSAEELAERIPPMSLDDLIEKYQTAAINSVNRTANGRAGLPVQDRYAAALLMVVADLKAIILEAAPNAVVPTPKLVVTVMDGKAEITGVSGEVHVVHADLDPRDEPLEMVHIDDMLFGEIYRGTDEDYNDAIAKAREGLELLMSNPSSTP
jgi:hypothetical protein